MGRLGWPQRGVEKPLGPNSRVGPADHMGAGEGA